MRKKRHLETAKEREERHKSEAQQRSDDAAAEEVAVDAMVKRSIAGYGP